MQYTDILLRYGELFLKGKNKPLFESRLIKNIKKITKITYVKKIRSRLITDYFPNHHQLKQVFGLNSYSPCVKVKKDIEEIKATVLKFVNKKTFKIVTNRADKTFPIQSPKINIEVGKYIEANTSSEFTYTSKNIVYIEINQAGAYVFSENIKCHGGLPTGMEGPVDLLIENKASILAGLTMMKRSISIVPVMLKKIDISLLQAYSPKELEITKEIHPQRIVVSGQIYPGYKKYNHQNLTLRPNIGFSEEGIKEQLAHFAI